MLENSHTLGLRTRPLYDVRSTSQTRQVGHCWEEHSDVHPNIAIDTMCTLQ
jgi:hypothetical protein